MVKRRGKNGLTDKELLADAWRELNGAPRAKTFGTASSSRSRAFSAKRRGICGRCGRFIERGDDVRFVEGHVGPVHSGCRAPKTSVSTVAISPAVTGRREPTTPCSSCFLIHSGECW